MPSAATTSLGSPKHLRRFILNRGGKTPEEIAIEENVSVDTVKNSIRMVEFKQGYHTNEFLTQTLIGVILKSTPAAQATLLEALTANTRRETTNDRGEKVVVSEPNHEVRLKALGEFREIAKAAQPKPGHSTNVKVGVIAGVPGGVSASGTFVGMEDRMRELRHKRKEQQVLPQSTVQGVVLEARTSEEIDEDEEGSEE